MEKRVFTEEDYSDFSDHTRDVGILFSAECVFLKPLLFFQICLCHTVIMHQFMSEFVMYSTEFNISAIS